MNKLLLGVIGSFVCLSMSSCDNNDQHSPSKEYDNNAVSTSQPHIEHNQDDINEVSEFELLLAINKLGYNNKDVLVYTERLKAVAPDSNKELGRALKQGYTFDWYAMTMLTLKTSEQMYRALSRLNDANDLSKAVEALEVAWAEDDLHSILKLSFYNEEIDTELNAIVESMSEEQQQKLNVDAVPIKALAAKLLEQGDPNN